MEIKHWLFLWLNFFKMCFLKWDMTDRIQYRLRKQCSRELLPRPRVQETFLQEENLVRAAQLHVSSWNASQWHWPGVCEDCQIIQSRLTCRIPRHFPRWLTRGLWARPELQPQTLAWTRSDHHSTHKNIYLVRIKLLNSMASYVTFFWSAFISTCDRFASTKCFRLSEHACIQRPCSLLLIASFVFVPTKKFLWDTYLISKVNQLYHQGLTCYRSKKN